MHQLDATEPCGDGCLRNCETRAAASSKAVAVFCQKTLNRQRPDPPNTSAIRQTRLSESHSYPGRPKFAPLLVMTISSIRQKPHCQYIKHRDE
jgi:hypothetical protein